MPNPTISDVHVNVPLTNISIAYIQQASGFVADQVFPNIPVQKQSDRYFRYDRSDFWRNSFQKRAPSTESAGSGWKIDSTPTYYAANWALHKDIDWDIRDNADTPLNMDRDATIWLAQQGMIAREVTWAANYFATGVWTGIDGAAHDVTGVAASPLTNEVLQWDDTASTPIEDVKKYSDTIALLTGMRPNTLTLGRQVWTKLSRHADLIDLIKYSGGVGNGTPAIITKQAAAAIFEIDRLLVADGIQVTSDENPAFETSMTTAFIAGKKALLSYANPTPSLLQPSAGYTFSWRKNYAAGANGMYISQYPIRRIKSDRVEADMYYDQKVVCTDCAVLFNTIVA